MKRLFLTLIMIAGFSAAAIAQAPAVQVYVYAEPSTDGFVDSPRAMDSVKDLREIVSKRKGLALAETRESADILLEVMSSGQAVTGSEAKTEVRRGIFGGVDSNTTVQNSTLPSLTVMLRVRGSDYSKELSFTAQRFWKDLAKNIVDQAQQWLKLNGSQLEAIRVKK